MTVPGRANSPRPNRSDQARRERGRSAVRSQSKLQVLLGGLIFLAVVASIIMVFTDSVPLLRIGLVAALWAAVIGAIAMTKYRKASENDAARARDLKLVYELQLEREISARREYELVVETQVRRQVEEQVRFESTEELVGLREEIAALRSSLEVLFDVELPDERTAVRAESRRLQELAGAPGRLIAAQAADLPPIEDVAGPHDEDAEGFEPDYEGYRQAAQSVVPGVADEDEDPQTAETQMLSAEDIVAQGYAVQRYAVQSYSVQGSAADGYTAEGYSAEAYSAQSFIGDDSPELDGEDAAEYDYEDDEEFLEDGHPAETADDSDSEASFEQEYDDVGEGEFEPTDSGEVDSGEVESDAAEPYEVESAEVEPEDVEPDDVESAEVEPEDVESDEDDSSVSEHSERVGGRSVADLMARLQASGTLPESVGRRRRRAED